MQDKTTDKQLDLFGEDVELKAKKVTRERRRGG